MSTFRKNSLFVGSLDTDERYANVLTVLLNCERRRQPYAYVAEQARFASTFGHM